MNSASPSTHTRSGEWTNIRPSISPFNLGDKYTVEQSLCSDVSPLSKEEEAVPPPNPMPVPKLIDGPVVEGQQLIGIEDLANGASTTVEVSGAGQVAKFSTAVSWKNDLNISSGLGSPLASGQSVNVESTLCQTSKPTKEPVRPCDDIPAPVIQQPFVGNTTISVIDSIPSARVLVYDGAGVEIGDSSGTLVALSRALVVGDVLTVVQKVGKCISNSGYVVSVLRITQKQRE